MRRFGFGLAAAAVTLATVSGCASGSGTSPHASAPAATRAAALVPAATRASGVLAVGSDISYAPNEFYDDAKTPQGLDYDLAQALAKDLGLRLSFSAVGWDDLPGAVAHRKQDVIMSSMTDTAERQKALSFIDYFVAGSQLVVKAANPAKISTIDDTCGRRVAVQTGTTHVDLIKATSTKCVAAGKPPVTLVQVDSGENIPAVLAGKADAAIDDYPVAAYGASKSGGALTLTGPQMEPAPYGLGVARDRTDLRAALQAALEDILADGTYAKVLDSWHITAGSLRTAAIDGGA